LLSGEARRSLRQSLLNRLSFTAKNPAEWMWNVLRANSALLIGSRGDDSEGPLRDAVFANGVEPLALHLLEHYPALARLWAVQVMNWRSCISQFLEHANTFAREYLGLRAAPIVRKIETDLSDPHSENRSVMQVWFEDGSRWFYKPRSGESEKAWFALLSWLNEQNFSTRFALVEVIYDRDHCWMRAVQHRQCRTKKEATRYYFRAGALLFLVHWLRGVDFHAGNIIAHCTQPIIVDCETLCHPKVPVPRGARREAESILRTGMLPIRKANPNVTDSVSALGRKTFEPHTVRVNGEIVSAAEFIDSITQGFQAMSRFLLNSRGAARILRRLRRIRYRRIYEPTVSYYRRLEHSLRPSVLISGRARHRAISRLCRTKRRAFAGRVLSEIQNLEDADIPIFHGKALRPRGHSIGKTNRNVEIIRSALAVNWNR